MEMNEKLHRYAQVLLTIGCDLKKDDAVVVEIPVEHMNLAEILKQEALSSGAKECTVFPYRTDGYPWDDEVHQKHLKEAERLSSMKPCIINLCMAEFADACEDVEAFDACQKQKKEIRDLLRKNGRNAGTIACVPSKLWADRFYPELPEEERVDALWDAFFTCTHCMDEDPVGFWKNYIRETGIRKKALDAMNFMKYRYIGEKSDFTFSACKGCTWMGGCVETPERTFIPNLPTQEVFLGPDRTSVNGHIEAALPLNYQGHIIDGISLDLEEGRIVRYSASEGEDQLRAIIETEEGTHYIGEVAAVEADSSIASFRKLFYTTLYDENASCHVAIGRGLGPGTPETTGINAASIHVDFMIGSETMNIFGLTPEGKWVHVFRDGKWQIH